jgi:chromosome segregation ATPase
MTYENPNRLFYNCKQKKCNLFCWCEPIPDDNDGEQTMESNISYAEARISRIEEEASKLKKEIEDVADGMKGIEDEICTVKVELKNGISAIKKELEDALAEFRKRVEVDLAAAKIENNCLYSEVSTLKTRLKAMEQSNGRLKCFLFGIMFVVLSMWIFNMK